MRTAPLPLFPEPLPLRRPAIGEFPAGCRVAFGPRAPGYERKGRVLVTLPHFNQVVIRTDDNRIADVDASRCRRIS